MPTSFDVKSRSTLGVTIEWDPPSADGRGPKMAQRLRLEKSQRWKISEVLYPNHVCIDESGYLEHS
jgi:hypothetical protein